jgi:PPOX class probable F420-dependent enzyme
MPSRSAIRMTDAEIEAFLAEPRTLNVATVGADGAIHLVAMWFTMRGVCPVFTTYGKSQKVANLRRDPRLSALVEGGESYDSLRGVELIGRAEIIDDPDEVLGLVREIGAHYGVRGAGQDEVRAAAKRVGIQLVPDRVISWDHAKIGAAQPST